MSRRVHLALALCTALSAPLGAQTDYYNTDAGHPLEVEDAHALERYALELRPFAVSASRHTGGVHAIELESEVSYGVLPRTQVDVAVAWRRAERGTTFESGLAGISAGLLYNLNVETLTLPALAFSAELQLPEGPMAAGERYVSVKALASRSFTLARLHLNAGYSLGRAPRRIVLVHGVQAEVPRWQAGLAIDRALALRSFLLSAEFLAERPTLPGHPVVFDVAAGARWQWTPRMVLDAGVARHLTGDDRALTLRVGASYARGLRF